MRIKKLTTRIRIQGSSKNEPIQTSEAVAKPELKYVLGDNLGRNQNPSPTDGDIAQASVSSDAPPIKKPDVRAIADRVYELMSQEIKRQNEMR